MTRFLAGLGIQGHETVAQPASAVFLHGDLIDSTMMTTDDSGSMGFQPVSYTAFGEPVWRDGQGQTHVGWPFPPAGGGSPPAGHAGYGAPALQGGVGVPPASLGLPPGGVGVPPASLGLPPGGVGVAPANDARYPPRRADRCRRLAAASSARALQAAGGWGYESGPWGQDPNDAASPGPLVLYGANPDLPPILLLHVGERWYQPDTGRFIQRDPIGLEGGINLYSYCDSEPLTTVDPEGLAGGKKSIDKGILRFGPSKKLVGYRKWTHPWTLRYKTHHFYGWRGWVGLGGLVCIAWDVGYGAGTLLDELHPWTDRKWHEHIGEWLYWEAWRGGDVERQGDGNVWY